MLDSEDMWRSIVNNLKSETLPDDGITAPDIETLPKLPKGLSAQKQKVFVQKIVTEMYVYTDLEQQAFGQNVYQTTYILGEMTAHKLMNLLEKEHRKKGK